MPSSVLSAGTRTPDIDPSGKTPVVTETKLSKAVGNIGADLLIAGQNTDRNSPLFSSSFLGLPHEILSKIASMLDSESLKSFRLTHSQLLPSARAATQKLTVSNGKDLAEILRIYKTGGIEELTLKGTSLSTDDLKLLKSEGVNIRHVNLDFTHSKNLSNKQLAEILKDIPVHIKNIKLMGCTELTEKGLTSALVNIPENRGHEPYVQRPLHLDPIPELGIDIGQEMQQLLQLQQRAALNTQRVDLPSIYTTLYHF